MPPASIENSLAGLCELVPQLTDDLLNHVDQPLKVKKDPKTNREFILCDYNRDGDSHRSPWSNAYYPEMPDGFLPSQRLRDLEKEANDIFDHYRKLYFEGGVSSVYLFNTDGSEDKSFGACFLIHKEVKAQKGVSSGWWDSIHVFEAAESKKGAWEYKLTTTVIVSMSVENDKVGSVDLSGSMTQQAQQTLQCDNDKNDHAHVANMGKMLEDMELKIRNYIEAIYIQKTREVINGMRMVNAARDSQWAQITASLNQAVLHHGTGRKKDSE